MWVRSLGREEPLEESKEIHSSIPAWRIPQTEEPGRLQSIGQQTVEHDRSDLAHTHTHRYLGHQGRDGRIPDQKRVEERGIWLLHGCDSQPVPAQEWEEERGGCTEESSRAVGCLEEKRREQNREDKNCYHH